MLLHLSTMAEHLGASLFERRETDLRNLFTVLDIAEQWRPDPEHIVTVTQKWVHGDHWNPANKVDLDTEQTEAARGIFREFNIIDARMPDSGEHGGAIVLGGTMRTNRVRTEFVTKFTHSRTDFIQQTIHMSEGLACLKAGSPITFWGGPRPAEAADGPFIQQSIVNAQAINESDPWLIHLSDREDIGVLSEFDQGRLAFAEAFGSLATAREIHLRTQNNSLKPIVRNVVMGNAEQPLVVTNAPSVSRASIKGRPRHTTASAVQDWVAHHAPKTPAKILFVSNNPYIDRTTEVVRRELHAANADHIEIVGVGPAAYDDAPTHLFLGEIGRQLYMANQARAA